MDDPRMRVPLLSAMLTVAAGLGLADDVPKQAAGMQVMILPTIQYAHQDIWRHTPNGRGPVFAGVEKIVHGQRLDLLVSTALFATNQEKTAEVNYRVRTIRPDGTAGAATGLLQLVPRGMVEDNRMIRTAAQLSTWAFEQDDPLGSWRVVVDATDAISGQVVTMEQSVELCGAELLQEQLPPGTIAEQWLALYYRRPAPQQLLAALKALAESMPSSRFADTGAILGSFEQILADNPWLLPHLLKRLDEAAGREQELLATCLAYAKREDLSFFQSLTGRAREAFLLRRVENWPAPTAEPLRGAQLDVLWGRFLSSGRFAPLRELVGVLAYHPHKDALEKFRKLKQPPSQIPPEVQKSMVFGAAMWSIGSNIQQHKLVRDYCEGILLQKDLPAGQHAALLAAFRHALENLQKASPSSYQAKPN
jgi:hypothetical protein